MKARSAVFAHGLAPAAVATSYRITGLMFLLVCLSIATLFVFQHFGILTLPGDHPSGGCSMYLASAWSGILEWPASFVGVAYFSSVAIAWIAMSGPGVTPAFLVAVRIGAIVSISSLLLMGIEKDRCTFCLVTHASHLVFWAMVERCRRATMPTYSAIVTVCTGFSLVLALLNVVDREQERLIKERIGRAIYESSENAVPRGRARFGLSKTAISTAAGPKSLENANADEADSSGAFIAKSYGDRSSRELYRMGSENAKARLVIFYDYQSEQCRRIHQEVEELLTQYGDTISITARHYPLCEACNLSVDTTTHPDSCRAALAAEAAGILQGNVGFWQVHQWLLQRNGVFTDREIVDEILRLGYDDELFIQTMSGPEALRAVMVDVVEAQALQISSVPTVVLNGKKLGGLRFENAISNAVTAVMQEDSVITSTDETTSAIEHALVDSFSRPLQLNAVASTVRIANNAGRSLGSGAIIAVRDQFAYALTANHLVSHSKRVEVHTFTSESYPEPSRKYPWATVIATSEAADIAVVRFSTHDELPAALPIIPLPLVPRTNPFPVVTIGCDGEESAPTCIANEVTAAKRVRRTAGSSAATVWEVAKESSSGRSGGPLVDQNGYLLGIASGISEGKGYFCHAEEIHQFLVQNGLQGLISSDPID